MKGVDIHDRPSVYTLIAWILFLLMGLAIAHAK